MCDIKLVTIKLRKLFQIKKNRSLSDAELREFVLLVKELKTERTEQLKWLDKLIDVIQKSGKLTQLSTLISRRGCFYATTQLEDVYRNALGDTFLYISQNLDKYEPTKEVMAWVNESLKWKFLSAFNKIFRSRRNEINRRAISLDAILNSNFNGLASEPCEAEEQHRLLREFILEDPEGIFKATTTTNDVTLQDILLMLLDRRTWREIAEEFQIPISTAERFCARSLKNPRIKDYFYRYLR